VKKCRALAGVLFLLAARAACPQESLVLLTTEYEPFCGVKGDTLWCDLVNAAFAREGIRVQWQSFPQEREKAMVAEGLNVAFLSGTLVVTTEERSDFLINADPMIYANIVAFYRKEKYPSGLGLRGPGDLKGRTVGVVQGTGSVAVLQKAGVQLDSTTNKDLLMKKLVAGREEIAVIADLTGLLALKEQFGDHADDYGSELVYRSPIDLVFSKRHPRAGELRERFNAGLARIKADGTFMRILERYYPKGRVSRSVLPRDLR